MSREPEPHGLLDEMVDALVVAEGEPRALLIQKNPGDATLALRTAELLVLLAYPTSQRPGGEVSERVAAALASERPEVLDGFREKVIFVALVGAEPDFRSWHAGLPARYAPLESALDYMRVTPDGVELAAEPPPESREALDASRRNVRAALAWACHHAVELALPRPASGEALARAERTGEGTIAAELRLARRLGALPLGVTLIFALNLGLWLGELWFGGSDMTAVLTRMGANRGRWVLGGEWWRVLSAGYLHVGFVHLGSNALALWMFGLQLEALLGTARLLVLYTLALAGSEALTAVLAPEQLGVGASGGLFGLMAAVAVLSWRRKHVPSLSSSTLMGSALVYLGLNLFASLAPGVGMLAHVMGGLCGGALALLGVPTWGLPPVVSGQPEPRAWRWTYRGLALGALALTGLAITTAVRHGQPWTVKHPPEVVRVTLTGTPITVDVPRSLMGNTRYSEGEGFKHFTLGGQYEDPLILSVIIRPLPEPVADERLAEETEALRAALAAEKPEEGDTREEPRLEVVAGRPRAVMAREKDGVRLTRWLILLGDQRLDVQSSLAPDAPEVWRRVATEAVASLARVPEEAPADGASGSTQTQAPAP